MTEQPTREIKFRGIREKTGESVYGYLVKREEPFLHDIISPIGNQSSCTWSIKRGSEGQYTGLVDSAGIEIFEYDIVKIINTKRFLGDDYNCYSTVEVIEGHVYVWLSPIINGETKRYGARLLLSGMSKYIDMRGVATYDVEVIGNKFENPELLEVCS